MDQPLTIAILQQDDDLVWVNKPAGLLSVPGKGIDKQDCVVSRVGAKLGPVREVHRLDMDTSGVMLLARSKEAHREMCRQFRQRIPFKTYVAWVSGIIEMDRIVINVPMRTDIDHRPLQIVDFEHGKDAVTHVEVISRETASTLVRLKPVTGRSHQLRVHLNHIGHPILGDDLYGPDPVASRREFSRLMLHATYLEINHPTTQSRFGVASTEPF